MTRSYIGHDSFIYRTWLVDVWHDSLICVTWIVDVWHDSFICFTWLVHMCDITLDVWHDSFICVPWIVDVCYNSLVCDITHSNVWHESRVCPSIEFEFISKLKMGQDFPVPIKSITRLVLKKTQTCKFELWVCGSTREKVNEFARKSQRVCNIWLAGIEQIVGLFSDISAN